VTAYEAVQIAPQLRYYSLDAVILGTSGLDNEAVLRLGGEYMEGAVFTCSFGAGSTYPPTSSFVFHFRRRYGNDPSILAAQGYDAASVLLDASSEGADDRSGFERALTSGGSIRGASGICTIGARTVSRVSLPLVMVSDGEIVSVE
ncbi:MAG TPA: ABC transporter substrate-binding protein, partial [Candidatus Fermentibacter sp.]|nr:ABC transporter substrate-binding protein [Candidatus Fermentibacter sp.]